MRTPWCLLFVAVALLGCRTTPPSSNSSQQNSTTGRLATNQQRASSATGDEISRRDPLVPPDNSGSIITTGGPLKGKIASVNIPGRFVVLRFPIGRMPGAGQRFSVYRDGLKVGELKVSGPHYDNNTVADITAGECQAGDEVRQEQ